MYRLADVGFLLLVTLVGCVGKPPPPAEPQRDRSPPPAWIGECESHFKKAAFSIAGVQRDKGDEAECRHSYFALAGFYLVDERTKQEAEAQIFAAERERSPVPSTWLRYKGADELSSRRRIDGRTISLRVHASDESALTRLETAMDQCLAGAPAIVAPPDDPTWTRRCTESFAAAPLADCLAAHRAARDLQTLCSWEDAAVGPGGSRGESYGLLESILALKSAGTPLLIDLAKSRSVVGRVAAAVGFGQIKSREGRLALARLASDHDQVHARRGCIGDIAQVATFASESLKNY